MSYFLNDCYYACKSNPLETSFDSFSRIQDGHKIKNGRRRHTRIIWKKLCFVHWSMKKVKSSTSITNFAMDYITPCSSDILPFWIWNNSWIQGYPQIHKSLLIAYRISIFYRLMYNIAATRTYSYKLCYWIYIEIFNIPISFPTSNHIIS